MRKLVQKIRSTVADIVKHPAKYRKAAMVPAATLVYVVSVQFGVDSTITLEVVSALTALGVYSVPNA
jgi:hypothetical protein